MDRTAAPNPLVNTYPTSDGRWITLLLLQPDRYWPDLCARIGREDLLADDRFADGMQRFMHAKELVSELEGVFRSRPLEEWRAVLADMEGPWAPLQTAQELHADPQTIANGYLPSVETDEGDAAALVAAPVQFDEAAPAVRRAPEHGADTDAILGELGYDWDTVVQLKVSGAVL